MRGRAPSTSRPSGRTSTRSACRIGWSPASSAASTTTRGPRSSSTSPAARASSRRSAAAGATTGSSSCSAASRRPGIGFGIGLDRLVLALDEQGRSGDRGSSAPTAVVVGADPADTVARLRIATDLRAAGLAARAELGRRKLGKQLESAARDQAHFAVIVGDELTAGEVQLRDLPAGTQKVVPLADLAREVARAHAAHRHGIDDRLRSTDRPGR